MSAIVNSDDGDDVDDADSRFVQTLRRVLLFRIKLCNNNDVINDDDNVTLLFLIVINTCDTMVRFQWRFLVSKQYACTATYNYMTPNKDLLKASWRHFLLRHNVH